MSAWNEIATDRIRHFYVSFPSRLASAFENKSKIVEQLTVNEQLDYNVVQSFRSF